MHKVNINTATVVELQMLPVIGPVIAEEIYQYRTNYGDFKTIEELKDIRGIGEEKFMLLRDKVVCDVS